MLLGISGYHNHLVFLDHLLSLPMESKCIHCMLLWERRTESCCAQEDHGSGFLLSGESEEDFPAGEREASGTAGGNVS